jgi:hypothetical protein
MGYGFLADAVVMIHVIYVAFVLFGQLAIAGGLLFRCGWARNFWFRCGHLLAIAIVVGETLAGVTCPLTTLENNLRLAAGQTVSEASFVGQLFHNVLFYNVPESFFAPIYIGFGLLVLATFVLGPPRLPKWLRREKPAEVTPAVQV